MQNFPQNSIRCARMMRDRATMTRIRHYGLLAGSNRKASLALARELLDAPPAGKTEEPKEVEPLPPCPCCGGCIVIIEAFERSYRPRAPPPALVISGRAFA
jgi:hypothetical protein